MEHGSDTSRIDAPVVARGLQCSVMGACCVPNAPAAQAMSPPNPMHTQAIRPHANHCTDQDSSLGGRLVLLPPTPAAK